MGSDKKPEEFLEAEPAITVIYETRRDSESGGMSSGASWSNSSVSSSADGGGGMTGSSGGAPYSTSGTVPTSSNASEPSPPPDMSDVIGVVQPPSLEAVVEAVMSVADVIETAAGGTTGPTILVPPRTLGPDEIDPDRVY